MEMIESDETLTTTSAAELFELEYKANGGYAYVYKATHSQWGTVAFKKLKNTDHVTDKEIFKLKKEAKLQACLSHPNIVKLLAVVFEPGHYGLVLEFMENGDMWNYLQKNKCEWETKLRMLHEVATGMSYLHSSTPPVIHADLKIQNVLIDGNLTAKIGDFGFSDWKVYSNSVSKNNVPIGTLTHNPPEHLDRRDLRKMEKYDVYGFAMLMWQAMTQAESFAEENNPAVIMVWIIQGARPDLNLIPSSISKKCLQLLEECWDKDPEIRPKI